ncbi:hypothetical protein BS47DRAFT_1348214 [Hydnum rufescens UP504]|uniref:Calcineurin-like phosphoesterase domain-containing protein n=1 Tax=Hydnum rufescens UP504 TaxID=1448309 RepID=A0A9P6AQQ0_9AGAM|nr:hypothetical protein BS47DRAFT_1348214 [Hydnum rufescens UP504]
MYILHTAHLPLHSYFDVESMFSPQELLNPYPHKPRVTYKNGRFKLSVFSDLHYGEAEDLSWGPEQDRNSDTVMRAILKIDPPDYVVINGDLITGENTFRENSTLYMDRLLTPLINANIPFSSTYGNHDNRPNISHLAEMEREVKLAPLSYSRRAPPGVGGIGGEANYWVPVYADKSARSPCLVLWFFDSRGGYTSGPNSTALPDWVDESVAPWIQQESAAMDSAWGSATETGRQALVFAHIPPSTMRKLQQSLNSSKEPGLNADQLGSGSTQGSNNPTSVGKELAWWYAVRDYIKNIHATVHGHAHGNEWCARDPSTSIILCFNKHTGYGGYSSPDWGHGVRTFDFKLGEESAHTYIRMQNGSTHAEVVLDKQYGI